MLGVFAKTVSAMCYEIASGCMSERTFAAAPPNDVTAFVLSQWRRMPPVLAWPIRLATIALACSALPRGGFFYQLPPDRRRIVLEAWRNSRLGPCRDVIRFYQSLAILAVYSREKWAE